MGITMPKTYEKGRLTRSGHSADLRTRERLIRSAETLFSSKGFRDVSVREIAAHAGANPALIRYYFRGKQALFDEVYRAHTTPLAQERRKELQDITRDGRIPTVEEVLKAWILPWLKIGEDQGALQLRFMANLSGRRWESRKEATPILRKTFEEYVNTLQKILPHRSKETIIWRMHFIVGALTFGIRMPDALLALSKGKCDPTSLQAAFNQFLPYAIAAFNAPEPGKAREQ
jgi:AcrR family transcriptional regulator